MALKTLEQRQSGGTEWENVGDRYFTSSTAPIVEDIDERRGVQEDLLYAIKNVAYILERYVADSREKALAHTKLEEALMWAGKAVFA